MDNLAQFGMFAGVIGYIANMLIDVLKPTLDLLIARTEMRVPLMKLLALIITGLIAFVVGTVAISQGMLDPDGFWILFLASFPGAGAWYQIDARRKKNSEPAN